MALQLDGERLEGAEYRLDGGRVKIILPNMQVRDLANMLASLYYNKDTVVIGFKDNDPANCRFENFVFKRSQNRANRAKSKSALYKGVTYNKGKWLTRFEGKYIGRFDQRDDAARAYDEKAKAKYGSRAFLNFKEDTV